jgi:hypothetical protein
MDGIVSNITIDSTAIQSDQLAIQQQTFQTTIEVLQHQRNVQADLVVELSVRITALTNHVTVQQQSLIQLQNEKGVLEQLYLQEQKDHAATRTALRHTEGGTASYSTSARESLAQALVLAGALTADLHSPA